MSDRADRPVDTGDGVALPLPTQARSAPDGPLYRVPSGARLWAWLQPARFDRIVAVSELLPVGHAVTAHAQRIISVSERDAIARSLRRCVREARGLERQSLPTGKHLVRVLI